MIKVLSTGTPIKQLVTGDLLLGSDKRFDKVLAGYTAEERRYVQFLLGNGALPKEFKDVDDARRAEIDQEIGNRFSKYPFSEKGLKRMKRTCVEVLGSGDFTRECVLLLAKSGVGVVYVSHKLLCMQLKTEVKAAGLKTRITNTKQDDIAIAIYPLDHQYARDCANDLMREHTPYLPVLLQGTRAQLGPLYVSGLTPCMNCLARTYNAEGSAPFEFGAAKHLPTLVATLAGMAVSKVLAFLNDRIMEPNMVVVQEPGAIVKHIKVDQSQECGCTHFAKNFTADRFDGCIQEPDLIPAR